MWLTRARTSVGCMANFPAPWQALRQWPANSQLQARRNAMVACTAMAQRTAQARDVEEFLGRYAGQDPRPRTEAPAMTPRAPGGRTHRSPLTRRRPHPALNSPHADRCG